MIGGQLRQRIKCGEDLGVLTSAVQGREGWALGEWNMYVFVLAPPPSHVSQAWLCPFLAMAGSHNRISYSPEERWRGQWAGMPLSLSLSLPQFGSGRISLCPRDCH